MARYTLGEAISPCWHDALVRMGIVTAHTARAGGSGSTASNSLPIRPWRSDGDEAPLLLRRNSTFADYACDGVYTPRCALNWEPAVHVHVLALIPNALPGP